MAEIRTAVGNRLFVHHAGIDRQVWRNVMSAIEAGSLVWIRFLDASGKDVLVNPGNCAVIEFTPDPQPIEQGEVEDEADAGAED